MKSIVASKKLLLVITGIAVGLILGCGSRGDRPSAGIEGGPEIVEGGVIFRYFDEDARRVHLVGDFNNWSPLSDPMTDKNDDGEWTLFYPLAPGRYEYKFVINGISWIPDPRNPNDVPDGFESRNSVVIIPKTKPRG